MDTRNYGYNPTKEEQDIQPEDFPFLSGKFVKEKFDKLTDYRPKGEKQRGTYIDSYMCVPFSFCKAIAYRMNWRMKHRMGTAERKWLEDNGFIDNGEFNASDLFLGIMAGVVYGQGTSMKRVLTIAGINGILSEKSFPFRYNAKNWNELTEKPGPELLSKAKKWLERYKIWYENVGTDIEKMKQALDYGALWVGGAAWYNKSKGIYQRVNKPANHAFLVDRYVEIPGPNNDYWEAPDSYPTSDGNYVKKLAWNYRFWFVKQVDVEYLLRDKEKDEPKYPAPADGETNGTPVKKGLLLSFWQIWDFIFHKLGIKK